MVVLLLPDSSSNCLSLTQHVSKPGARFVNGRLHSDEILRTCTHQLITYTLDHTRYAFILALAHYQTPVYEANSCPGPMEISLSGIAQVASPSFGLAQYENEMFCSWLITAADDMVRKLD